MLHALGQNGKPVGQDRASNVSLSHHLSLSAFRAPMVHQAPASCFERHLQMRCYLQKEACRNQQCLVGNNLSKY